MLALVRQAKQPVPQLRAQASETHFQVFARLSCAKCATGVFSFLQARPLFRNASQTLDEIKMLVVSFRFRPLQDEDDAGGRQSLPDAPKGLEIEWKPKVLGTLGAAGCPEAMAAGRASFGLHQHCRD